MDEFDELEIETIAALADHQHYYSEDEDRAGTAMVLKMMTTIVKAPATATTITAITHPAAVAWLSF